MLDDLFQTASAVVISVPAGSSLTEAAAQVRADDILGLTSGVYKTRLYIDKPLTIGNPTNRSAKIQRDHNDRTIAVHVLNVISRDLIVTQPGLSLFAMDAGVYLEETVANVLVRNNNILENPVGIYLHGPKNAMVRGSEIVGNTKLYVAERGSNMAAWDAPDSWVAGNDISRGHDDIFSNTSTNDTYKNNRFFHLRYVVHYIYANDSEVGGNTSVGSNVGYVLMLSNHLRIYGNATVGNRDQDIILNYVSYSDVAGNVTYKTGKRVFMYNANYNSLHGNYFEDCNIGIHFTTIIKDTGLTGNSFISNENQAKYVSACFLDWGGGGHDSYRDDSSSFDLDGDGFGNNTYRPDGIIDQITWRAPVTRLLIDSPAVSIVK